MAASKVYYLTLSDIEDICFYVVRELFQFDEPLPEFETRFPSKLESVLEIPKQGFGDEQLYPNIFEKATCYFYFIIKDHPFLNGNKRLAIVTTYVFLRLNGLKFSVPPREMYDFALQIARSTKSHKREFKKVATFIKSYSRKASDK